MRGFHASPYDHYVLPRSCRLTRGRTLGFLSNLRQRSPIHTEVTQWVASATGFGSDVEVRTPASGLKGPRLDQLDYAAKMCL